MRRILTAVLVLGFLLPGTVAAVDVLDVDPTRYIGTPDFIGYVPDRFIIVLKDDVSVDHRRDSRAPVALALYTGFDDLAQKYQVATLKPQFLGSDRASLALTAVTGNLSRHYKVTIGAGTLEEAMADYAALPDVERVEPIGVHTLRATPNDGYYDDPPPEFPYDQWHYWDTYGIEADQAWDSETGSQAVLVGDLDIGTKYDHGDLGGSNPPGPNDASTNGNIWVNTGEIPGNSIDDDGNGYVDDIIGWDFVDRTDWYIYNCTDADCGGADNDPSDGDGHGTHTAGTIAAITNNGYAVAGVAGGYGDGTFAGGGNGVKVVPCRIGYRLSYQGQNVGVVIMDYVAEAMYYMAQLKVDGWNVAAINCSFGTSNSGGLAAACDYLIAQDVMIIVAAGNSNSSSADYLGARTDCLDVGATNQSGNPASFSNYGSWVDVAAPGVMVMSTFTDPADPGGDYIAPMDGTSMSCPHVVGVAALLESFDPSLSAQDKWDLIVNNTKPYNMTKDVGVGIVDVRACLDAIGPSCDLTAAFSGSPTEGCAPLTVNFTDQSTGTGIDGWLWTFGDGGTSTVQNPSYSYMSAGIYSVTLTVSSSSQGCDKTETKTGFITVQAGPVAGFSGSPTTGTEPLTVTFTDLSTGNPDTWNWDFGDGGSSMAQNPSYTYNNPGVYTVTLTAGNACGSDVATEVNYITVNESGPVEKAYAQSDISIRGTYSGSYVNTLASDNSYEIITEALSTSHPRKTTSEAEHKWTFNITSGGSNYMFYVEAYRTANSEGDDFAFAYSTDDVTYNSLVTVASTTEQVYSVALPNLSGTVYVRATDGNRSWDNNSLESLYVDEMYFEYETTPGPPVADFVGSPTSGSSPLLVNFTDVSSGNPTSWAWTFGDGGTSTDANPSYSYDANGTYTVSLAVTNAYGSDSETKVEYITVADQSFDMHVHDIVVGRRKAGPNYLGTCTVTIYDANNLAISGATVYITAIGPTGGSYSGATGADGTVYFETGGMKKPTGEWCFEVTDVTHETYAYDAGSNNVTAACESGWLFGSSGDQAVLVNPLPTDYGLFQNYPNPFNPTTEIGYNLPYATNVTLEVYNIAGQKVATLATGFEEAGQHVVRWDASDYSSGIYLYRLTTDNYRETIKMILLK